MSENAPKILIVVLVVIIVFFVVGVGVGASGGGGSFSVDGVINTIGGLFPIPGVSMSELSGEPSGCFDASVQRIIIPGGGECLLRVAESSATARSLKLAIVAGGAVHLELSGSPVAGKDMTVSTDLPSQGESQINLTLFTSGGTLLIDECVVNSGSACVINIVS